MIKEVFEIAGWVILSSVKYIVVILTLLAKSPRDWYYDMIIVATGGCMGVFVFTFLGAIISKYLVRFSFFKIRYKNLRRFVLIKNGYGLIGLAFLTPLFLGVPLGCIITCLFEPNKATVLKLQLISVILWSVLLFVTKGIIQFYH